MARGNSCIFYPEVNGEASKLYKKLLDKGLSRPKVNYLYAKYTVSNMADAMDSDGYQRNSQGQHDAEDLLKFINFADMQSEILDITNAEKQIGAIDNNGQRIDYTDAEEALEKAEQFNNSHKALIAYVAKHGNIYNVMVTEKTADNNTVSTGVSERLRIWDLYKQVFNTIGIDIENLPQEIQGTFNAYNAINLVVTLQNLSRMSFQHIYKDNAMMLFNMDLNSAPVQRIVNVFGSIENAAQALDDFNHGNPLPSNQETLLRRAITHCQNFQGLDLNALRNQVSQMSQQVVNADPETAVRNEIKQLNRQYNISINEIHRKGRKIEKLSETAADAVFVIQRQIRELEDQRGNNAEGRRLEGVLQQLMKELNNKKYYSGMLNFLSEAQTQIADIDTLLNNTSQTGTELDKELAMIKTLQNVKKISDAYYPLVSALANEETIIDERIDQTDIDNIRQSAKDLKELLDKKNIMLERYTKDYMGKLLTQIIGNEAPDGQPIINVVQMAAVDSSMMDFLYSMGRASNPIIAAMGSIVREAQNARDPMMNRIALRIRRANDKLRKAKHNSEFMYEDEGHIISDIDWQAYKEARTKEIKRLYAQGLDKFDLKQAIEDWEDANTEDRVVDTKNNRTERVPNSQYRKNNGMVWNNTTHKMEFHNTNYTQAQQDYYNEMMQLKGEIGSLLPAYAQHHYLPPQVRRSMLDAIGKAKSAKDVYKAISNKIANLWTVREDDPNYAMNGIIDADEFKITKSDNGDTPLRQIPIFNINRVEQGELLLNFSTGLQALAGSAINYYTMNGIADVVEFMGDFVKDQDPRNKKLEADVVEDKQLRVVKDLIKWGKNTNNTALVEGFINKHIYGQHFDPKESKLFTKIWSNIIGYTSFKSLATNIKGAFSNYLVGEFQMMIEAGAGEFYGFKDYAWAHTKLLGGAGAGGDLMELLTNNMNHKSTLFREMFDPVNENFSDKSHKKYYNSMFRQLVSHDCSMIGYASGEFLIHYVNMYAILHHQKVLLNGQEISLYDAFELTPAQDGNSELKLKQGVTDLDGNVITNEWLRNIRKRIRYANQSTHGAMNAEDKGLIHQYWWGRGVMNFRQWMVEHYSRRFRQRHFDDSLGMDREGYWISYWNKVIATEDVKEKWENKQKLSATGDAIGLFMKDWYQFIFRAQAQWPNLSEMEKYNIKRVHTEMSMFAALLGLSFALGEPDRHKKEWWRRWWIYQTKRLILDTEASFPNLRAVQSATTILQSPMAGIDTFNSLLYTYYGLFNGDLFKEIKSGPHKGENKYWRNIKKNVFPFFKDWEQMQRLDQDNGIFKIFEDSPSNY